MCFWASSALTIVESPKISERPFLPVFVMKNGKFWCIRMLGFCFCDLCVTIGCKLTHCRDTETCKHNLQHPFVTTFAIYYGINGQKWLFFGPKLSSPASDTQLKTVRPNSEDAGCEKARCTLKKGGGVFNYFSKPKTYQYLTKKQPFLAGFGTKMGDLGAYGCCKLCESRSVCPLNLLFRIRDPDLFYGGQNNILDPWCSLKWGGGLFGPFWHFFSRKVA